MDPVQKMLQDLERIQDNSVNEIAKRFCSNEIEILMPKQTEGFQNLSVWLQSNKAVEWLPLNKAVEQSNNTVERPRVGRYYAYRLTDDARKILRGIFEELHKLHERGAIHKKLTAQNILVKPSVQLLNATYEKFTFHKARNDFNDLKEIIHTFVGRWMPDDVRHLTDLLGQRYVNEDLIFNHPCLWTSEKMVEVINKLMDLCCDSKDHYHLSTIATKCIPSFLARNWKDMIPQNHNTFQHVLNDKSSLDAKKEHNTKGSYEKYEKAIDILLFMRNCFKSKYCHGGQEGLMSPTDCERDIFVIFPTFMAYLIEGIYNDGANLVQIRKQKKIIEERRDGRKENQRNRLKNKN